MIPKTFTGWKSLRQKNAKEEQERYYPLIPSKYIDFCDENEKDMPIGLLRTYSINFTFYYTSYPHLQSPTNFLKELTVPTIKLDSTTIYFSYNDIQERLYNKLYNFPIDNKWFEANDDFIKNLTVREKLALVAMTNKSQQHVQAYLRNNITKEFRERVRKWNMNVYGYLPIFFPIIDHLQLEPSKDSYIYIVTQICPSLSDNEIDHFIENLYHELEKIFKKCPKTTEKMIVLRGIKTEYKRQKGSGFTSATINPLQSLVYSGERCCIQRITVLPKTPLIFIGGLSSFPDDMECLFSNKTEFFTVRKNYENLPIHSHITSSFCPKSSDMRRILVHEMVT